MMGGRGFSNTNHLRTLGVERRDRQKDREDVNETKLKGLVQNIKGTDMRLILRAKITGAWMIVHSTTVSGKLLSDTEFRDFLCAHYNAPPPNLQSHCNGCGTPFGLNNALSCSTGGLFIVCHNKICDKLLYIFWHAFTSASVRAELLIHQECTR